MAYKRRKGRVDLRRTSLATLKKHLTEAQARVTSLESSLAECRAKLCSAPWQLQEVRRNLSELDAQLSQLRDMRQPKKGVIGKVFGLTEQSPDVRSQIAALERQQLALRNQQCELERLENSVMYGKASVERAQSWLAKLEEAVVQKQRKKDSLIELRAAAAANSLENRKVGESVRRRLSRQPWCPYCGGPLRPDSHADHIYPVSKGGRSVPKNMVYVCSECNGLKRNLTLTGFIRKYGLDRVAIENRLELLGKEF